MSLPPVLNSDKLGSEPERSGLWPSLKDILPSSQIAQQVLSFILFVPTALILLSYPLSEPLEILRRGLRNATTSDILRLHLMAGLAAWLICVIFLKLMWQVTNSSGASTPTAFIRYLLFSFLFFFTLERLGGYATPWPQSRWLTDGLIQICSSIATVAAVAAVLPHLRNTKEGFALAKTQRDRFLAAAESSLDDFYLFDGVPDDSGDIVDFRFSYINPNAERRLKISRESLYGKVLTEVRPFMTASGLIEKYREVVRTGRPYTCEIFIDDDRIAATWLDVQVIRLGTGIAITSRDVTERRRLTDQVYNLAHYDQLTGLANRTLLQQRLQEAIIRAQRFRHKIALFMLDIDHFKRINDSLGHADGDLLLAAVGKRLLSSVRRTDTVARLGGDEFVIVMPDFKTIEDVKRYSLKIIRNAAQPVVLDNREINITVSVGVCIYPDCGSQADELLKNADAAMYVVKETGRNGFHIFEENSAAGQEADPLDV